MFEPSDFVDHRWDGIRTRSRALRHPDRHICSDFRAIGRARGRFGRIGLLHLRRGSALLDLVLVLVPRGARRTGCRKARRLRRARSLQRTAPQAQIVRACGGACRPRPGTCGEGPGGTRRIMLKEFRDFIIKGNALQLAVGVIMAVAFGAVIVALNEGVLMALIAAIFGKPDFNALSVNLNGTPIQYGRVLTACVNLALVGGVLFVVIKAVNRVLPPTKTPETDHELLAQIRDELRSRPRIDAPQPTSGGVR
ncbi:MAG TPA: MscL family protein [Kofleriaceae bacterium]|nr:MscL family protein [Kofleriaceae bacterium]